MKKKIIVSNGSFSDAFSNYSNPEEDINFGWKERLWTTFFVIVMLQLP